MTVNDGAMLCDESANDKGQVDDLGGVNLIRGVRLHTRLLARSSTHPCSYPLHRSFAWFSTWSPTAAAAVAETAFSHGRQAK